MNWIKSFIIEASFLGIQPDKIDEVVNAWLEKNQVMVINVSVAAVLGHSILVVVLCQEPMVTYAVSPQKGRCVWIRKTEFEASIENEFPGSSSGTSSLAGKGLDAELPFLFVS